MRNFTLLSVSLTLLGFSAAAQTTVVDSVQMGAGYANDIYYSFNTGKVSEKPCSDWQLGFGIGTFNVAVRANTTASSTTNDGSVAVYEMPGTDTTKWTNFDTTNYKTWAPLDNSDEDWEAGALNVHSSGMDYGWGEYDESSHIVTGHRLYLAVIKTSTGPVFKKVWIVSKEQGTWNIRFGDLDGATTTNISIKSTDYPTKNFVYVSLANGTIVDREPNKSSWDFIVTRYKAWQPGPNIFYPSTGILTNAGVKTAEARGVNDSTAALAAHIKDTTSNISEIGYDWKALSGPSFVIVDSLCYFVKAKDGAFWKLVFTKFAGGSTGNTVFAKTKLTFATSIDNITGTALKTSVYPNPSNTVMNVLFDTEQAGTTISMMNMEGKILVEKLITETGFGQHTIDVSSMPQGVYFIKVTSGGNTTVQKVLVN